MGMLFAECAILLLPLDVVRPFSRLLSCILLDALHVECLRRRWLGTVLTARWCRATVLAWSGAVSGTTLAVDWTWC